VALYSTVQLTAEPGLGAVFVRWSGDVSSTSPVLELVADTHKSIRAEFAAALVLKVARENGGLRFSALGASGETTLESSTNLVDWESLGPVSAAPAISMEEAGGRFFRVRE
jgi:hypothetical protein